MANVLELLATVILLFALPTQSEDVLKIKPDLGELLVKPLTQQVLQCEVTTSRLDAKLSWEAPSSTLFSQESKNVVNGASHLMSTTITIDKFEPKYNGNYSCVLKDGAYEKRAYINLRAVTEKKEEPIFNASSTTAALSCSIDLTGIEDVVWLQNYTLVSELKDKDRFVSTKENFTLTINNPTIDDANLYIARFTINNKNYDCEVEFRASPQVMAFEKSKNLIQDDTLELQCKVKGYPRTVVTWYKDDEPLNVTLDSQMELTGLNGHKNARLRITKVDFAHGGDYKCEAYSKYFNETSSKTITVRVKDKLAALWPFLGIVGEVVVLCTIIFIYEKRRNKQAEQEENNAQESDENASEKKDGLRHRNTTSNNPSA
ncbi:basigin-like [Physella acuta]|uniref:basigin-like n=1 Tax=Physella acuta TaxID=109671 RepID=UPI0027DC2D0D|nr:basigin-like [Physella acuta]